MQCRVCRLCIVQCRVCIAQCTVCIVQCRVCSVQSRVCIVQSRVCSVQCGWVDGWCSLPAAAVHVTVCESVSPTVSLTAGAAPQVSQLRLGSREVTLGCQL